MPFAVSPEKGIAGNLFVITGTVRNVGKGPSRGIRVQATLFGKDNQVLLRQTSIVVDENGKSILPYMKRAAIEEQLAIARYPEGNWNHNVPPGEGREIRGARDGRRILIADLVPSRSVPRHPGKSPKGD